MKHVMKSCLLLCALLYLTFDCFAQTETNWPKNGYAVYLDNDADTVIIRNTSDEYVGRMTLVTPGADYHEPANIDTAFLFDPLETSRVVYDDINKNGFLDGYAEDFNQYADGPLAENFHYRVFGTEYDSNAALMNGYVTFSFTSPYTVDDPPFEEWFVVGLIQRQLFSEPLDLHNSTISFDIKTSGLTTDIPHVLTVSVWAKTYDPTTGEPVTEQIDASVPAGYLPWRLQNYQGQVFGKQNTPLYDLPATSTWETLTFNISDLVFCNTERHWYVPDFSDVVKCDIYVLQVYTSEDDLNDFVAAGDIYIDNIKIGNENDVIAQVPLENSITLLSVTSESSHPAAFYPGDKVSITLQANKSGDFQTIQSALNVYDGLFDWDTSFVPNSIFDSTRTGETYQALAGHHQGATCTFSFRIPGTAQEGTYYILGTMIDPSSLSVLDTTGPDISMDDTTTRAFVEAFSVSSHPNSSGPVAIFDVKPPVVSIEESAPHVYTVQYTLDAGGSFHIEALTYEIVTYEWDVDNDGIFDVSTDTPQVTINDTLASFDPSTPSFVQPVALRVTDNASPAQINTMTKDVVFTQTGNITITALDTDASAMGNASCLLYDASYTYMGDAYRRLTNSSGHATWQQLPVGSYYCEVYAGEDAPFDLFTLRIIDQLIVVADESQTIPLTTNTPHFTSVSAVYLETGLPVGYNDTYLPGTSIKLLCSVQNSTNFDQICSISTILDRDKTQPMDITVNDTPPQTIEPGATHEFSVIFSVPKPFGYVTYPTAYFYAVRLNTFRQNKEQMTDYTNWVRPGIVLQLPSTIEYSAPFTFSGYQWNTLSYYFMAGLSHDNAWLDNDSNLVLTLQDYSGVGSEVVSVKDTFHYGTYTARLKTPATPTELPDGGLFAFFFYWWTPGEFGDSELNEIDLELRTLDIYDNDGVPCTLAAFTVHNQNTAIDSYLYSVTKFCPVYDINQPHEYSFQWTKEGVTFFIDGHVAITQEGEPAVIDQNSIVNAGSTQVHGQPLGDRIPYHRGAIWLLHVCDEVYNTWMGMGPPQGTGDMVGIFYDISYTPAAQINGITFSDSYAKLLIGALDSTGSIGIYASDQPDGTYTRIGGIETVSGQTTYQYIDTESASASTRYYKLYYE